MAYVSDTLTIDQDTTEENTKQLVDVMFPAIFGSTLHNRKDSFNLKLTINTGGDDLHVLVYTSHDTEPIYCGLINTATESQEIIDISDLVGVTQWWQIRLVGLLADFKLSDLAIDYEDRPDPLTFKFVPWVDLGASKKRIRVWPVTLDTLGENATIIPYVDGVAQPTFTVNSTYAKTFLYQFTTDVFGIDYAISIHCCGKFELYKIHEPTGVQTLPIAKRFDQVGSTELFRYGKIHSFIVRLIAFGGTSIPYRVIFQDLSVRSGVITVTDSREGTFEIMVEKTTGGEILRIELGPTDFDFHRFYVRVKCALSGQATEMKWVDLE